LILVEKGDKEGFTALAEARDFILTQFTDEATVVAPCGHDKACPMLKMENGEGTKIGICKFGNRLMRSSLPRRTHLRGLKPVKSFGDVVIEHFSYCVIKRNDNKLQITEDSLEDVRADNESKFIEIKQERQDKQKKEIEEERARAMQKNKHGAFADDQQVPLYDDGFYEDLDFAEEDDHVRKETLPGVFDPKLEWFEKRHHRIMAPAQQKKEHLYLELCTTDGDIERWAVAKSHKEHYRHARKAQWGDLWPFEKRISNRTKRKMGLLPKMRYK